MNEKQKQEEEKPKKYRVMIVGTAEEDIHYGDVCELVTDLVTGWCRVRRARKEDDKNP